MFQQTGAARGALDAEHAGGLHSTASVGPQTGRRAIGPGGAHHESLLRAPTSSTPAGVIRPAPAAGASTQSGRDEPIGGGELRRRLFHARGPGKTSMSAEDAEALRAIQEDIFSYMDHGGGEPAEEALGDEGGP